MIIGMFIISSCSYYGAVNEKGERVNALDKYQQQSVVQEKIYVEKTLEDDE